MARTRIYFVSDVHASERCWLKFLAAPKFYEADTVIIGGDITGKFIVPIRVQANGNWLVENFLGRQWRLKTREELAKLKAHIADTGQYAFETTDEEYAEYEGDQPKIDELFRNARARARPPLGGHGRGPARHGRDPLSGQRRKRRLLRGRRAAPGVEPDPEPRRPGARPGRRLRDHGDRLWQPDAVELPARHPGRRARREDRGSRRHGRAAGPCHLQPARAAARKRPGLRAQAGQRSCAW